MRTKDAARSTFRITDASKKKLQVMRGKLLIKGTSFSQDDLIDFIISDCDAQATVEKIAERNQ